MEESCLDHSSPPSGSASVSASATQSPFPSSSSMRALWSDGSDDESGAESPKKSNPGELSDDLRFDPFQDLELDLSSFKDWLPASKEAGQSDQAHEKEIFPNIETLLTYAFANLEGRGKIADQKVALMLLLLTDDRLKKENFPRNLYELHKLDAKMLGIFKGKIENVVVQKGNSKSSQRKQPPQQVVPAQEPDLPLDPSIPPAPGKLDATVNYVTIESRLRMALSDPIIKKTLRFGRESPSKGVTEFNQTPFAETPNKFAMFLNWGDYECFDDVEYASGLEVKQGRIIEFGYQASKEEPHIRKICRIHPYTLLEFQEFRLDTDEVILIPVEDLKRKIRVTQARTSNNLRCNTVKKNGQISSFDPLANTKERFPFFFFPFFVCVCVCVILSKK